MEYRAPSAPERFVKDGAFSPSSSVLIIKMRPTNRKLSSSFLREMTRAFFRRTPIASAIESRLRRDHRGGGLAGLITARSGARHSNPRARGPAGGCNPAAGPGEEAPQ